MVSSGKERRRWSRVPVGGKVEGRIHTVAGAPVIDLSVNGALLEVPCSLRPGTIYPLRLSLGAEFVVVKGRVVRSFVHHFVPLPGGETQVNYRPRSSSDLPHVFDRFYRASQASRKTKGAGLGLFLARAVRIEAHGGRIWVDPKPGDGARICFSLPREVNNYTGD